MECVRYTFSYTSSIDQVKDYIWRAIDYSEETYGRDSYFCRFNQMLDQARFLGWKIPRFSQEEIPEVFQDLAPEVIDHIFESQAKILVDVSPISEVILESGKKVLVRMVCGTTPVGDLVWKTHFLRDSEGHPCIDHKRKIRVKIKGTKVVCNPELLPFDEDLMISYFDMENKGIWPVPFLPEFFSHHPLAKAFSIEDNIVEVVKIEEAEPVRVIALDNVPWYRSLIIDRTKALPLSNEDEKYSFIEKEEKVSRYKEEEIDDEDYLETLDDSVGSSKEEPTNEIVEEEDEDDLPRCLYTNVVVSLSESESKKLTSMIEEMDSLQITSKEEAQKLQSSETQEEKLRGEKWLLAAVNRLALLANCSFKMGALIGLVQKHRDDQVLIIQPREKWADVVVKELNKKGINSVLLRDKALNKQFVNGKIQVGVVTKLVPELLTEDLVIISVSAFAPFNWIDLLDTQQVYGICVKELGLDDLNYLQETSILDVEEEVYQGPGLSVLVNDGPTSSVVKEEKSKEKPEKKLRFKVKTKKGKPVSANSLEKAMTIAKKKENKGQICEIYDFENNLVYVTHIGETV